VIIPFIVDIVGFTAILTVGLNDILHLLDLDGVLGLRFICPIYKESNMDGDDVFNRLFGGANRHVEEESRKLLHESERIETPRQKEVFKP
jgi:hypothetical protein